MQSVYMCFVLAWMTFVVACPHAYDSHTVLVNRYKRQLLNVSDSEDRGTLSVSGGHQRSTDSFVRSQTVSHIRADANYNFLRNQGGNSGLYGTANYQRNFGDTPVRQQYGVGLEYRNNDRGSVGVEVGQQTGTDTMGSLRNTNIRTNANYYIYRNRNGNTRLSGNAYYQKSFGGSPTRADYGGGVVFTHTF